MHDMEAGRAAADGPAWWNPGWAGQIMRHPRWLGAGLLAVLYFWSYFSLQPLPGNEPEHILGWFGWFDQSKYLASTRALAKADFDAAQHWYPMGYAVLGAPFALWSAAHPFVVVNLASLLLCYAGFLAFARRAGVAAHWAVPIFLLSLLVPLSFLSQWAIPWNTSPASAAIWLLLACVAAHLQGARRPFWIGALAVAIPLLRPTEALMSGLCVAMVLLTDLRRLPPRPLRDLCWLMLGGLLPVVLYGLLHLRIYGWAPSAYMIGSRGMGFTLHDLGWKAYTVLMDPGPWYLEGRGLLRRAPYLALALAGIAVAFAHGRAMALLAVMLVVHTLLYLSYVDLLPSGMWRFLNFHYWKWATPGATLLGFVLLRDLLRWRRAPAFPLAPMALALSVPLLCLRLEPVPVADAAPAKMLTFAGTPPIWSEVYFGPAILRDSEGELANIRDVRLIPVPGGMRLFALRRAIVGPVEWVTPPVGWQSSGPPGRFAIGLRLGRPCWLTMSGCPRFSNPLMPPEPVY